MKLLYCPKCHDLFKLMNFERQCMCGHSRGKYIDEINSEYVGGIPIGADNYSFANAIKHQPDSGLGERFDAFVIPKKCDTCLKKEK